MDREHRLEPALLHPLERGELDLVLGRIDAAGGPTIVRTAAGRPTSATALGPHDFGSEGLAADRIDSATVDEALKHPTWRMGAKISVDSATLVNKALEVIEAHFLFGLPYDRLGVVVHPQSIVHAFVEFDDGSVLAQLGLPSMELPILYALTWPERVDDAGTRRFDPVAAGPLTFEPVRRDVFRGFAFGAEMGRKGCSAPTVFNAANEAAVAAFLRGAVQFGRIAELIERV